MLGTQFDPWSWKIPHTPGQLSLGALEPVLHKVATAMRNTDLIPVWEDPTCQRSTGPVCHHYWSPHYRVHAPQEKPPQWEAPALQWRVVPPSLQLEKPRVQHWGPKIHKQIRRDGVVLSPSLLASPLLKLLVLERTRGRVSNISGGTKRKGKQGGRSHSSLGIKLSVNNSLASPWKMNWILHDN